MVAISTGTAILGAAALGTAGSVASGIMGGRAASRAADAQVQAADRQAEVARYVFDTQRQDNRPLMDLRDNSISLLSGFRGYGGTQQPQPQPQPQPQAQSNAFNRLKGYQFAPGEIKKTAIDIIGGNGRNNAFMQNASAPTPYAVASQQQQPQGYTQDSAMQNFYGSPEYRMALQGFEDEGDNYIASQAALGGLYSGATMKRMSEIERRNAFNAFGNYRGNIMQEAGLGQVGASNNQAAAGQFGASTINALGQSGAAKAQGYMNRASAYGGAIQGIANVGGWALGQGAGGWS